jgi:hypothetical protein
VATGAGLLSITLLVSSGCWMTESLFGPSMPEPGAPSWEQPGSTGEVVPAGQQEVGRHFWNEEMRRKGQVPQNPDYGYMKPGHAAKATGYQYEDVAAPIDGSRWAEPLPAGPWGATSRAAAAPVSQPVAMSQPAPVSPAAPMSQPAPMSPPARTGNPPIPGSSYDPPPPPR